MNIEYLRKFELNLAYHFAEYLNKPLIEPHWIYISLTHECNNTCRMCGVRKILPEQSLDAQTLKGVLKEISSWQSSQTVMFTGGEPFLREDIFELIDYSLFLGNETEVVSNGSRIDKALAEKIIKSELSNIAISLDGVKRETHDYIRGKKGSFAEAVKAVKNLIEAKKKYKQGPQISVWTTIMDYNLEELFEVAVLSKKLGVECLVYHPVILSQEDMQRTEKSGELWIPKTRLLLLKEQIDKIVEYKQQNNFLAFSHDPYLFMSYFEDSLTKQDWKCNPFEFINVGPDGNVSSCGRAFGNIKTLSLRECLNLKSAQKARAEMKKCKKPCLQTCWARPEADTLSEITDAFLASLNIDGAGSERELKLRRALVLLDKYQDMLGK